jgi:hypothetical protein
LQPRGETLRLRDSLDFDRDRVDRCLDSLEASVDRRKLARRDWSRLQPARYQADYWKAQNHDYDARNYPRKHFVND